MNLASIVPPPAAPAATAKVPAGSATATGAAGFLAVLATKFAVTAASGVVTSRSSDAADGDVDGTIAQDLLTLAALASRAAGAALPQVVPTIVSAGATESEAGAELLTPTEPDAEVTASSSDAVIASPGGLDVGSALPEDVVTPAEDVRPDVATGEAPSPEATDALPDVEVDGPVIDATVDAARPAAGEPIATEATTDATTGSEVAEPATTTRPVTGTGDAVATEPDADGPVGQRADPVVPAAGRGRGRADGSFARIPVEGGGTVRAESVGAPTSAAPGSAVGAVRIDAATPSAAAQRVLDLVTQLEDAPPPRVVVIDTGEIRVRLGLDAGTVRMTVLGPLGETGEELLREAADALEAGGFGSELDRGADGDERGGQPASREDRPAPSTPSSRRPAASARAGLQL